MSVDTLLYESQEVLKTIRYLLTEADVKDLPSFYTYKQGALKMALEKCNEQILKNAGVKQV